MRQSTFTPAEKMNERYNIEPAVLDELKQVSPFFLFLSFLFFVFLFWFLFFVFLFWFLFFIFFWFLFSVSFF